MFFELVYASSAVAPFSSQELVELLAVSRRNNERVGVTGMLLHHDGNFIQVLEGEQSAVEQVFARVAADPRHRGVQRLFSEQREARDFRDWSMAFRNLSDPTFHTMPGFSEFLNHAVPLTGSRARKLLQMFRQTLDETRGSPRETAWMKQVPDVIPAFQSRRKCLELGSLPFEKRRYASQYLRAGVSVIPSSSSVR